MGRVIVVDDKELMRDSVGTILARRGHTVVAAAGGRQALARIAEKSPDAVQAVLRLDLAEVEARVYQWLSERR